MSRLYQALEGLHNAQGLSAIEWFDLLLDAGLAAFGRPFDHSSIDTCVANTLSGLLSDYETETRIRPFEDVLGDAYQQLAGRFGKKALGQFFTPSSVCKIMAQIMISKHDPSKIFTLSEPSVGGGAILLAFLEQWFLLNKSAANLAIYAVDLDRYCTRMAALQVMINLFNHNHSSIGDFRVFRGDTLSNQGFQLVYGAYSKDFPSKLSDQTVVTHLAEKQRTRLDEQMSLSF